jgi:hypothetical protein
MNPFERDAGGKGLVKSVTVNTGMGGGSPIELLWHVALPDSQKTVVAQNKVAIAFLPIAMEVLFGKKALEVSMSPPFECLGDNHGRDGSGCQVEHF